MSFLQKIKKYRNYEKNHSKNDDFILELLREKEELDWLEFKSKYKLYESNGKVSKHTKDEFIKDILGLANGNSRIIKRYKYLLIGVDDCKFDENQQRVLHNVEYKMPSLSEISKWLKDTVTPSIVGIEMREAIIENKKIILITIPPTFHLHETTRELVTNNGTFQKPSVFMRQNEHTVPAGIHDGITIMDLKHLYRKEIANPPAVLIGLLIGGILTLILCTAMNKSELVIINGSELTFYIAYTIFGLLYGGFIGWIIKQFNEARYDWKYLTRKKQIITLILLAVYILIYILVIK